MIRTLQNNDIARICEIYNHYVENTIVTFEEKSVSQDKMQTRINKIKQNYPFIVYEKKNTIYGYAYASQFRKKSAYRFTVESTIYLAPEHIGKGIGAQLYQALIKKLRQTNIQGIIGVISLPNPASQKLHQKLGFEKVGQLSKVGYKFNTWIDVEYWELLLSD